MSERSLEQLIRLRGSSKGALTALEKAIVSFVKGTTPVPQIRVYLDRLNDILRRFEDLQVEVELVSPADELEDQRQERYKFDERYLSVKAALEGFLYEPPAAVGPSPSAESSPQLSSSLQLPKIAIPPFSGRFTDWLSFSDLFRAAVHDHRSLTNSQKLQYLKASLSDEPLRLIQALAVTDDNYEEAFEILRVRYENRRCIVQAHLSALFTLSPAQRSNGASLRRLLDGMTEHLQALKVLGLPVVQWDAVLVYLLTDKLDQLSRQQWEFSCSSAEFPTFSALTNFVRTRCLGLEATSDPQATVSSAPRRPTSRVSSSHLVATITCVKCSAEHELSQCPAFSTLSFRDRRSFVRSHRLCFSCFRPGHIFRQCKSPPCSRCGRRLHSLLHQDSSGSATSRASSDAVPESSPNRNQVPSATLSVSATNSSSSSAQVLLATACVLLDDSRGSRLHCRALLDSGSQANFVTEACAQRLGLRRHHQRAVITGIGSSCHTRGKGSIALTMRAREGSFCLSFPAIVLPTISSDLPHSDFDVSAWTRINQLPLADPTFNRSGSVDLLLGAEIVAQVMSAQQIKLAAGPVLFATQLGYIVMGRCPVPFGPRISSQVSVHLATSLEQQMQEFWQIEEAPFAPKALSSEEQYCEDHFSSSHYRCVDGRYVVRLPMKDDSSLVLGESRSRAVQQWFRHEAQLAKNSTRLHQYHAFLEEYEALGHMERVPSLLAVPSVPVFYIPHHAVIRESSTTTKLRVVFNASCPSSSGVSLNDKLLIGPALQPDIRALLLRFRAHPIAFMADIEKMYRQILIHPDDQELQRVVWRSTPSSPLGDFRLKTVTYGTSAAPFLAIRTLKQLALDEALRFPIGARVLSSDFYVDDLISGADSIAEALVIQSEVSALLAAGGFHLRKWASNAEPLLAAVPPMDRELQLPLHVNISNSVKALGIRWHPQLDVFSFEVGVPTSAKLSKRAILSAICKLFDPLGWFSPVVIVAKRLIQELWLLRIDWDSPLPPPLSRRWVAFRDELQCLQEIRIPRHFRHSTHLDLHGFCDASEGAYAAVVYTRFVDADSNVHVSLLCSKSRVAPLKQLSIPRLELSGALLLAQVLEWVSHQLHIPLSSIHAWTDSTIVLCWLAEPPRRWKTFVANRVSQIQTLLPSVSWHHIASRENPADCCSRGLKPSQLVDHSLWWDGPPWLHSSVLPFQDCIPSSPATNLERRSEPSALVCTLDNSLLSRFSNFSTLLNVVAYCLRFAFNVRVPLLQRRLSYLVPVERSAALLALVRLSQSQDFAADLKALQLAKALPSSSRLQSLFPFVDGNNILRVGGRLQQSPLSYDQKHPMILSHRCPLSALIVRYEHLKNLHAGPSLLFSLLRQRFWILKARDVIRACVFKCVTCFKLKARAAEQLMGNLPAHRVEPARPFLHSGVDYAGPISLRLRKGPGRVPVTKAYVVVFVCFATKALHLELATELSADCFIAALHRFVARRGLPSHIYSDCGTNFVGAQRVLQGLPATISASHFDRPIVRSAANDGIEWHFNPPASPHFGGLWEAGVKSVKFHLRRIVGNSLLTYEEFYTSLAQIEACLNSRPLCPLTADPEELQALTPAHFLIGDQLTSIPDPEAALCPLSLRRRWNLTQGTVRQFWDCWRRDYLHRLQQRSKWTTISKELQVGDLVLLRESNFRPLQWPLARIVSFHPGRDGISRVATIRTSSGLFKRPIIKLCKLPFEE